MEKSREQIKEEQKQARLSKLRKKKDLDNHVEFVKKYFKGITVEVVGDRPFINQKLYNVGERLVYKGYLKRDDTGYPILLPNWAKPVKMEEYKKLVAFLVQKYDEEKAKEDSSFNIGEIEEKRKPTAQEILEGALDEEEKKDEEDFDFDSAYSQESESVDESSEEGEESDEVASNQFV